MVLTQHLYNNYSSRGRLISLASLRTELFFPISKSRKRDSNIRHLLTCTNERKLYRYNIPNLYTNYFYYTNYCRLSCIGPRQNEIRLISSSTISNNDTDADNNNALNSSSDEASSSSLMNDLRVELYWTCHELISFQNDIGNDLLTSQFEQSKKHYLHKQQQTIMNQQQRHQPPQQPEIQNLKSEHHNNGSILECDIPNQVLHEDYEKDEIVLQELDYEKDVMNPIENNNNYENNINIDTEQNTKFNNSLLDAIILLRLMSKDDWKTFDEISNNSNNVEVEKDVVDDIQVTDEVHVVYDDIIVEEEEDLQTRHNNNEIDATTQSDEILSSLVPICLEQMEMGEMIMSTNDVNVLLAIVALTPDSSVIEESLDLIIEIYQQMIDPGFKNYVKPDAITYEIIILTLHRRLNINTTTVSFIWDELILSKKRNIEWTVELLEIILQVCEDRKSIKLAHHILSQLQPMNDDVKKMEYIKLLGPITKQSFHSLLNVMKASDNAIENVITICKMALRQTRKKRFRSLDSIFIHVLKLPTTTRSKKGQQMLDANDFVKQILNLWDEHRFYSPTYQVWRQFIITASSGSGEYQDKEKLFPVIKAYERLLRRSKKERFYLDSILLKHGIDAATCSNRTDLASTLITKFVDDELYKLNSSSIDNQYHIQIPVFDILKVIDICTNNNDIDSCRIILSNIDRIREHILPSHIRLLCVAGLNTFAKAGAFEIADKLLSYMRENDLKPGDECYASLIEAAGVCGDVNNAEQILHMIASGEVDDDTSTIGILSYESFLRICIDKYEWDKVIRSYLDMEVAGITPSKKANFYYMMATLRLGSESNAKQILKDLLDRNLLIGDDMYELTLQMFFPDIVVCDRKESLHTNVQLVRKHLIQRVDDMLDKSSLQYNDIVTLIRSLELANVEDIREPHGILSLDDIELRRQQAWRTVMLHFLSYDDNVAKTTLN